MAVDVPSTSGSSTDALRPNGPCLDPLTGLPGPAFWKIVLATESARIDRYGGVSSVVLAEVAGFDELSAAWGADVADQVLVAFGRAFRSGSRGSDYAARLGPARFGLILTATDEVAAINFIDRVRERCERHLRGAGENVRVVFGWASPKGSMTLEQAASRAEQRLGTG